MSFFLTAVSVVRPVYTRSTEFPPFAFRICGGELALPEIVGDYSFTEPTVGRPLDIPPADMLRVDYTEHTQPILLTDHPK